MDIPYTVEPRPDTGLNNGRLGIWLFLGSETLFFASLFSAYVLLRLGAPEWPRGAEHLDVGLAAFNSLLLIASSVTMLQAWHSLVAGQSARGRRWLLGTIALGVLFTLIKLWEWNHKLAAGLGPSTDTFFAIYFTLTGAHLLHLVAGLVALLYLAGPGFAMQATAPARFANRVEITGIYWHFVDLVWILVYATLYLT